MRETPAVVSDTFTSVWHTHTHTHTHTHMKLNGLGCAVTCEPWKVRQEWCGKLNYLLSIYQRQEYSPPDDISAKRKHGRHAKKTKHKYNTLISWWKLPNTEKPHLREISKISEYFFVSWSFFEVVGFHMCERLKTQLPELLEGLSSSINYLQTFFYF